jgi:hypothetical protein
MQESSVTTHTAMSLRWWFDYCGLSLLLGWTERVNICRRWVTTHEPEKTQPWGWPSSTDQMVFDRILEQRCVTFNTKGLHQIVFVESNCSGFHIEDTRDFFH